MWTRFMDMHSGGDCKEDPFQYIYIEAPEEEAKRIFFGKFGHNPERVSCTCCGDDYSIGDDESLENLTGYDRGCKLIDGKYVEEPDEKRSWNKFCSLDEYFKRPDVLMIRESDILPEWRSSDVPEQGYVWRD